MIILPSLNSIFHKINKVLELGIFIGGSFISYGGSSNGGISVLNSDATINPDFFIGTGFSGGSPVTCDIQSDGKIIIGGSFTSYNETDINRIARLNSDGTLDATFNIGSGFNGTVNSVAIQSDNKIIIAGSFTSYNGTTANNVVRLNSDGSIDLNFNIGSGFNNTVNVVEIQSDGKIIIGGSFTSYNGTASNRIIRLNSDGTIDNTFTIGSGFNGVINSVAVQSDGKIITGGFFSNYNGSLPRSIARLNSDGTIDTTFSTGIGFSNASVNTVAVQSDGKVIAGGSFSFFHTSTALNIVRINSNGSIDTSFNTGNNKGFNGAVNSVAIQSDGKIVVGGYFTNYYNVSTLRNRIIRVNSDGSVDTGFNIGTGFNSFVNKIKIKPDNQIVVLGVFKFYNGPSVNYMTKLNFSGEKTSNNFNTGTGFNNVINTIKVDIDNKIILGGSFTNYNGTTRNRIIRLKSNGSIDTSFNIGGGFNNVVSEIAIQSDGKIIAVGSFTSYNGTAGNRIIRLNSDGSIDATFNIGTGANNAISGLAIQSDGKIVIVGNFTSYNGTAGNRIARLNTDGTIDNTFTSGSGFNVVASRVLIQSDEKILAGGTFTSYNGSGRSGIIRLNSDGTLDTNFNIGSGFNGTVNSVAIQSDGKILAGGTFATYNTVSQSRIARLNSDGSRDTSFNIGTGFDGNVNAIAIQSDGKIIIGGNFSFYNTIVAYYIARLNSDGSLDLNFNSGSSNAINAISIM